MVSAARFRSMLANRRWEVGELAVELDTEVDLAELARTDTEVTFKDLEILAKRFKRPWPYLLIDDEERFPDLGQDHRTFFNQLTHVSADLISELEGATQTLAAAIELFPDEAYEVPSGELSMGMPAGAVGGVVRAFLGVSYTDQISKSDDYAGLRMWVTALESRGVYVSQRRLADPSIRAYSKAEDGQAIVVIDTTDTPYARCFSLLHEYAHILLNSTGICDLDQHIEVERYCNQVAASVLVPLDLLSQEMGVLHFGLDGESDDAELRWLSDRLRVSQAALLIRLQEAGWISDDVYEAMEARRKGRRAPDRDRGGTYYAPAINRAGRRFSRNVFGVMDDGVINRSDAATLLGINEHIVPRYRRELFGDPGESR